MVGGHENVTLIEGVYQLNLKNWVSPNRSLFSACVFCMNESLEDGHSIKEYGRTPYLRITQVLKWPPVHKV